MNNSKVLIDTNILIYAWNSDDRIKQDAAITTLKNHQNTACLSIQNLSEFSTVMLRNGCNSDWIKDTINMYERLMTIYPLTIPMIREALRAVRQYRMSYWDAQIWAVAKSNLIPVILTEDGPIGQTIEGVLYRNPLSLMD